MIRFHPLWAVLVPALLAACGGGASPPPATPADLAAPPDVAALSFQFDPVRGSETVRATSVALQQELIGAGYQLTTGKTADAVLELDVALAPEHSFIQVSVNGRTPEHVTAMLLVRASDQIIDQYRAEFTSSGEVKATDIESLVTSLSRSNRLARLAQTKKQSAEARVRTDAKAAEGARVQEESLWSTANASGCAAAAFATACAGLEAWLTAHPTSTHAQEASRTLGAARPKVVALADAASWNNANPAPCKAPRKSTDCDGVQKYISTFPDGLHADEARALEYGSRKKIDALNGREDARAEAERKHEEALARAEARRAAATQQADAPAEGSGTQRSDGAAAQQGREDREERRGLRQCLATCQAGGDAAGDGQMVQQCISQCGDDVRCVATCRLEHGGSRSDRCALSCAAKYPGAAGF